ncbi:MAG: hypothetical protein A2V86_02410 [Deltaproteobacteria bacterium RBG_16_49_23]|nr:MAG: hypothetical protein A2V86_02410 [Deltaproteobacteria bacterium RBG_16_49_23]
MEQTRPLRLAKRGEDWEFPRMSLAEKEERLKRFHPSYKEGSLQELKVGPSKGYRLPPEFCSILESWSRIDPDRIDLSQVAYVTDVLIIGGGGAGTAVALLALQSQLGDPEPGEPVGVPRCPYPPSDFECLYRHSCPYLDGLSTQWVLEEYRRAHDVYQEHLRIIDLFDGDLKARDERIRVLERDNAQLRAKLQALHRRQFKPNEKKEVEIGGNNPESPSSSHEGEKKKRGATPGHPGWVRPKPQHIDRTVEVPAPTICPHCQSEGLAPIQETTEHVQEDIVIQPQTLVTCYRHGQAFCARCNRPVVQAGKGELLNAPIGPVAKSVALYLRYRIGISYRKTTELFRELFGLEFVPASALGFDRKAAAQGMPIYEDLRDKIRTSELLHADETSWRNDGVGHFIWFAGNQNLAFFHIDRHRSAEVAKSIFGENFDGTLVRDRYAAYNGIGLDWQTCIAHIITKAKEIRGEHALLLQTEKDTAVAPFCNNLIDLCSRLCDTGQKLKSGHIPRNEAAKLEKRFVMELNPAKRGTNRPFVSNLPRLSVVFS